MGIVDLQARPPAAVKNSRKIFPCFRNKYSLIFFNVFQFYFTAYIIWYLSQNDLLKWWKS